MYTLKVASACLLYIQEVTLRLPALVPFVVFVGRNRKMMEQYAKTRHNRFLPHYPKLSFTVALIFLAVCIAENIVKQSNKLVTLTSTLQKWKVKVNWSPSFRMTP
jgi:hypothetical protein